MVGKLREEKCLETMLNLIKIETFSRLEISMEILAWTFRETFANTSCARLDLISLNQQNISQTRGNYFGEKVKHERHAALCVIDVGPFSGSVCLSENWDLFLWICNWLVSMKLCRELKLRYDSRKRVNWQGCCAIFIGKSFESSLMLVLSSLCKASS